MICRNCKKTIDDDSLFCKYCGKSQDASQVQENEVDLREDKDEQQNKLIEQKFEAGDNTSRKTINPLIMKIVIGLIVLCALVIEIKPMYRKFHKNKIDLEKYVKVKYEGYDGYGVASYEFDEKGFSEEVKNSLGITSTKDLKEIIKDNSKRYKSLENCISSMKKDMRFDKDSKLANGDEVVFTINFNNDLIDKYGIKFTGGKLKYKVEGLGEIKEVDPFKFIRVIFYYIRIIH